MRILSGMMLGILLLTACRQEAPEAANQSLPTAGQDSVPLPPTLALSVQVRTGIEGWAALANLQQRMEAVYRTQEKEELELLLEELVVACRELETSEFPPPFDRPSVKSRLKVYRTFLQKTQADLHYRISPRQSLAQAIEAYNAFRAQLNRVASDNLDPTIFDHE